MQGSMQQHPPNLMQLRNQQTQHAATLEPTSLLSIAQYNTNTQGSKCSFQHTPGNKPVDMTFQQLQPEDPEPCSDGHTPNNPMPSQKNPTLLCNTAKSTNIYTCSGYKMDISLKSGPADSGRHQQIDLIDKTKEELRHHIGTMTSPHIQSN